MLSGLLSLKSKPLKVFYTLLAFLGITLVSLIIFSPYIPYNISLQQGEISDKTISSPRYIEFQSSADKEKTAILREKRKSLVSNIYSIDEGINKDILASIVTVFTDIKAFRDDIQTEEKNIPESLNFLAKDTIENLLTLNQQALNSIEYLTIQNTEYLLNKGIKTIDKTKIRQEILSRIGILNLSEIENNIVLGIITANVKPNLVFDEGKTNEAIQNEINSIKPFVTQYKEGQPILYKGEKLSNEHIEVLKELNLYGAKSNILKFFSLFLFTSLLFILIERFVFYFNRKVYSHKKYFFLVYFVVLFLIAISRLILDISFLPTVFDLRFFIPISISAMVLSLLVTPNISLICGAATSLLIALMYQSDFAVFLFLFLSNCTATFTAYKRTKRTELINTGYVVGLFNVLFVFALGIFQEGSNVLWFTMNFIAAFFNGVLSSMISLALLPYLESVFSITTQQKLMELGNLNHPLLKKLMMTAPGTYQHSLMVATLAEAAAEAVNADPVVCRVGSYFHDIGKMKRPMFFSENQIAGENPHNTLSPRMSKLIIASHTKDGVDFAKKYKLPKVLQDIMLQHHGTALVSFFFTQALKTEEISNIQGAKEEFRYPGPKPQFKEAGIIMMADTIEAAVRAMEKPSPTKIENLINKLINDKITDGQLSECPLSLKDIEGIRDTFLKVFSGMYHSRIDYQEEMKNMADKSIKKDPKTKKPETEETKKTNA